MPINQETKHEDSYQEREPEEESRLGLKERNAIQIKIIEKMIKSGAVKTGMEWAKSYSEPVSDIIDNPQNVGIRKLIEEGNEDETKYAEAADSIISLLLDTPINEAA